MTKLNSMFLTESPITTMNSASLSVCPYKCCQNKDPSNHVIHYSSIPAQSYIVPQYLSSQLKYNSSMQYSTLKYPSGYSPNVIQSKTFVSHLHDHNKKKQDFTKNKTTRKNTYDIESLLNNNKDVDNKRNTKIFKPYMSGQSHHRCYTNDQSKNLSYETNQSKHRPDPSDQSKHRSTYTPLNKKTANTTVSEKADERHELAGLLRLAKVANEQLGKELAKEKRRNKSTNSLHLWEFLLNLLLSEESSNSVDKCIEWTNKEVGEFRLLKTSVIADLWGKSKNRTTMTYEKMARAMRYYYKMEVLVKVPHKRLHFQFGPRLNVQNQNNRIKKSTKIEKPAELKIDKVFEGSNSISTYGDEITDNSYLDGLDTPVDDKSHLGRFPFYKTSIFFPPSSHYSPKCYKTSETSVITPTGYSRSSSVTSGRSSSVTSDKSIDSSSLSLDSNTFDVIHEKKIIVTDIE